MPPHLDVVPSLFSLRLRDLRTCPGTDQWHCCSTLHFPKYFRRHPESKHHLEAGPSRETSFSLTIPSIQWTIQSRTTEIQNGSQVGRRITDNIKLNAQWQKLVPLSPGLGPKLPVLRNVAWSERWVLLVLPGYHVGAAHYCQNNDMHASK